MNKVGTVSACAGLVDNPEVNPSTHPTSSRPAPTPAPITASVEPRPWIAFGAREDQPQAPHEPQEQHDPEAHQQQLDAVGVQVGRHEGGRLLRVLDRGILGVGPRRIGRHEHDEREHERQRRQDPTWLDPIPSQFCCRFIGPPLDTERWWSSREMKRWTAHRPHHTDIAISTSHRARSIRHSSRCFLTLPRRQAAGLPLLLTERLARSRAGSEPSLSVDTDNEIETTSMIPSTRSGWAWRQQMRFSALRAMAAFTTG